MLKREEARALVHERLEYFNKIYQFKYQKVFIKNLRSRWGSCSKKGNLNFNYRIIYLPEELIDYLIVHELCHLKEFNHGPKFWALVEQTIQNYKNSRLALRKIHIK
ncbi:M48 family metallopeptidase [Candidatus Parcubacteria bacterium]|nr:M48 family metallopeptidase [Candidatus Parcubacteria bacterium]